MVFLSFIHFVQKTGRDITLRRQRIFRLSAKFYGRRRNCYTNSVRAVQKALKHTTNARKLLHGYVHKLRVTRLEAACGEHDTSYQRLSENLVKCKLDLSASVLTDLAIWEPKTFKSLAEIARIKNKIEAPEDVARYLTYPDRIIINKDKL